MRQSKSVLVCNADMRLSRDHVLVLGLCRRARLCDWGSGWRAFRCAYAFLRIVRAALRFSERVIVLRWLADGGPDGGRTSEEGAEGAEGGGCIKSSCKTAVLAIIHRVFYIAVSA